MGQNFYVPGSKIKRNFRKSGFTNEAGRPPFLQADGEGKGRGKGSGKGLGFYIIDNPLGKRGPSRFAYEAQPTFI